MKKINVEKIIAVSGMPGLFKVISNGTKGVIVENLMDKKRTIVLNNSKIFALDTIRIFVNEGELPINEALYKVYETLNGQAAPHHKNASDEEIKSVFEKSIPDYDKERVHINNMRKLFQWYNILHAANLLEVVSDESPDNNTEVKTNEGETVSENQEVAEVSSETSAPKKRGRKKKSEDENK
ncbi:MAG: hypothetical protein KatS3mg027_1527 [Bacteroidia bacterium]|nr:MAG: hypothetical protein KatS3mg027_1527 [Bacteroidia bacterium]